MQRIKNFGFTLIEMLIVVAIIGILSTVIIMVINPTRQLAKARDTQRRSDLFVILAAIYQYSAEHSGSLPDTDGDPLTSDFPDSATCIGTGAGCFDLASAGEDDSIVPVYMIELPVDPKTGTAQDIGYTVYADVNNHLYAGAIGETTPTIEVQR